MDLSKLKFETLQLHAGYDIDGNKPTAVPIYQSNAYNFESADYAADLFALKASGHISSRISNPTQQILESRVAALEGGIGALALSSGHAAALLTILTIAEKGDNFISASTIYGGLINMFTSTLPKMGITVKMENPDNIDKFEELIDDKTKGIFIEIMGNPNSNVADVEAFAKIAHKHNLPLIVDNTFGSPYLVRPIEHGADIVIHSATKYIGGQGTAMGGIIVDSGKFNWASGRFDCFTNPDPSYHGIVYVKDAGEAAFITKARVQMLRDLGPCISPFNAFLLIQGLETLAVRMDRVCENALYIAENLEKLSDVEFVNYPGLKSSKYYDLAKKYMPKGQGGVFTFGLKGSREKGKKFIDSLELFKNVANLGDSHSLVSHPASTTHSQLSDEALNAAGISQGTIRLSIGLENKEDLLADLLQAIDKAKDVQ